MPRFFTSRHEKAARRTRNIDRLIQKEKTTMTKPASRSPKNQPVVSSGRCEFLGCSAPAIVYARAADCRLCYEHYERNLLIFGTALNAEKI